MNVAIILLRRTWDNTMEIQVLKHSKKLGRLSELISIFVHELIRKKIFHLFVPVSSDVMGIYFNDLFLSDRRIPCQFVSILYSVPQP